jgi:hypothetical protein
MIGILDAVAGLALAWELAVDMPLRSRLYMGFGLAGIAGALLVRPRLRPVALLGLLALLAFDLFYANRNFAQHPYHNVTVLDAEHEAFDFIRAHQGLDRTYINSGNLFFDYAAMAKQGTLRGIYSITDYEPLSLDRYGRFYPLLEGPNTMDYNVQTFMGRLNLDPSPARVRLFDMMSVRFIAAGKLAARFRAGLQKAGWQVAFAPVTGNLVVYENPDPIPRAYVATADWSVAAGADALTALTAPGFDPRKVVVIESNDSQPLRPNEATDQAITPARITEYAPTHVVVEADAGTTGYLVLTDTYYPGWQAALDGHPTPIHRANYLFRAVAIPPGHHTVTFTYAPRSFMLGAGITLLTLGGLAIAGAFSMTQAWRRSNGGKTR